MLLWIATLSVRDAKGQTAKILLHLVTGEFDEINPFNGEPQTFVRTFMQYVDPMIDGQFVGAQVALPVSLPVGIKTAPLITADVEEGALLIWRTELNTTVKTRIPTFSEDFVHADGSVAIEAPEFGSFETLMTHPIDLSPEINVEASDKGGSLVRDLVSAIEKFKKSRRG